MRTTGNLKKVLFTVTGILAVVVVTASLAEGLVRIRHWMKYGGMWSVEQTFNLDPATGLRVPTPKQVIGNIRINSLGFRSPEIDPLKPPSTIRLAFLGSSTTYCGEVSSNEMTWPHLVWETLQRASPEAKFDYVNAAVPGYGVARDVQNLHLRVKPLEPDVIVIYEAANDLSFDSYDLARSQGLVVDVRSLERTWLSRHSLAWFLIGKNLVALRLVVKTRSGSGKLRFNPWELSRGFERRLLELVEASQKVASVVALATFSTRVSREQSAEEQARAALGALYYMPHMSIEGLIAGYEEYNRVIREVARQTGAILIDGETRIPADGMHYTDTVHFTDTGSKVMAERVSRALLAAPAVKELVRARVASAAGK